MACNVTGSSYVMNLKKRLQLCITLCKWINALASQNAFIMWNVCNQFFLKEHESCDFLGRFGLELYSHSGVIIKELCCHTMCGAGIIKHWNRGNPRLWVRLPALAGSVHDWGETLEQGTKPPTAPRAPHSRLPTAPGVCALGWVKCRENHVTPHYTLYNCVCNKYSSSELNLYCIFVLYIRILHSAWK